MIKLKLLYYETKTSKEVDITKTIFKSKTRYYHFTNIC